MSERDSTEDSVARPYRRSGDKLRCSPCRIFVPANVVLVSSISSRCSVRILYKICYHRSRTGGADNSLARPGREQATATEDFDLHISLISDFRRDMNIVYFLLGISPASNCSWPTFRNPVSVPSSKAGCTVCTPSL